MAVQPPAPPIARLQPILRRPRRSPTRGRALPALAPWGTASATWSAWSTWASSTWTATPTTPTSPPSHRGRTRQHTPCPGTWRAPRSTTPSPGLGDAAPERVARANTLADAFAETITLPGTSFFVRHPPRRHLLRILHDPHMSSPPHEAIKTESSQNRQALGEGHKSSTPLSSPYRGSPRKSGDKRTAQQRILTPFRSEEADRREVNRPMASLFSRRTRARAAVMPCRTLPP